MVVMSVTTAIILRCFYIIISFTRLAHANLYSLAIGWMGFLGPDTGSIVLVEVYYAALSVLPEEHRKEGRRGEGETRTQISTRSQLRRG